MWPAHKKEGDRNKHQAKNSHQSIQYRRTELMDSSGIHLNATPKEKANNNITPLRKNHQYQRYKHIRKGQRCLQIRENIGIE